MSFKSRPYPIAKRALTKWLCALFLLSALALLTSVPAVYAASNITVTTTTDEDNTGAGCSLREAITTANTNADYGGCTGAAGGPFTIDVPAGTYTLNTALAASTDDALQIGPSGSIDVTISGAGAATTLIETDAATCATGTVRVFDLDPNVLGDVDVTISGVTISNGIANSFGGGAILGGGTGNSLTLTDSKISDNCTAGSNNAAGISWSPDGDVTITNSSITDNVSGQAAGGLLFTSTGTLAITDSTFSSNTAAAAGSAGGALFLGSTGIFNIQSSTFNLNQATDASGIGGGIYVGGGTLNLTNSTLNANSASAGGGIANLSTLNVTNSTLAGNTATTNGGGISNTGTTTLKNTIVTASTNGNCYVSTGTLAANPFNLANDTTCGSATNSASINLDTLGSNGGPTETMALLTGSSAIDAADDAVCNAAPVNNLDQRGLTRPVTNCDTGAFEIQGLVCAAGQYDNAGTCVDADPGYYVPSPGATSQTPCDPGYYQDQAGQTSCIPADPGNYVDAPAASTQTPCAVGYFQSASAATSCDPADPGNYVDAPAASTQTPCAVGYFQSASAATSCDPADPGNYVDAPAASTQTPCAVGYFQSASAATSCDPADPGSYVDAPGATTQTQCAVGYYQASSAAALCNSADPGNFVDAPGATTQTQCAVGYYQSASAATSCDPADPGNYVDAPGATTQTQCAVGYFQSASAATSCDPADAGSYVDSPAATTQIPCAAGSYQPDPGQSSCLLADADFYVPGSGATAQLPCPLGTTSGTGATVCTPISALNFVVTKTADTNDGVCDADCSLREAITAANANAGADTITFNIPYPADLGCAALNLCTIPLGSTLPAVSDDVTIDGSAQTITVSGSNTVQVMIVNSGKTLNLTALTIADGNCDFPCIGAGGIDNSGTLNVLDSTFAENSSGGGTTNSGIGGAIQNKVGGTLNVRNSTFASNASLVTGSGGGILNFGTLTVTNSTFYNNLAASGAAIENSGTLNVLNSTFSDNMGFGSIENYGTATLYNTIVAGASPACSGTVSADPFNLVTDGTCGSATTKTALQLVLGALGSNGGPTQTVGLGYKSAAIDAGDNTVCDDNPGPNNLDQRGQARNDLKCDVGAFEFVYTDGHTVAKGVLSAGPLYTFGPTLAGITSGAFYSPTVTINRELPGTRPGTPPASSLPITWDATAETSGFSFIVTLCYDPVVLAGQNEATLHVYHYNGSTWDDLGGTLDDTTHLPYHCITATTALTSLSPLLLAPGRPTAVDVSALRGRLTQAGAVRLKWHTLNESFLTGFNVYRKTRTGEWEKINRTFLNAKQPGSPVGAKYRFRDFKVKPGETYRYKVEVLYTDNHSEWTEPVTVKTP